MLFDTFVTTVWKPSCAKLRECTKVGYESALNCHILPQWSGRDMDAISMADIESWLDSFDKPGAARKAYAVFRAILRLAFKRGLTDNMVTADNPFRTTDGVFVLCQLCPNGMSDAAGRIFEAFFWDMTDSRLRFRIRRADNHEWVNDQQPVRVYWVAFKQQS